ncbi:MAG TPA: ferrochelatase [Chloroflexota bacterium]|nr:ferrochelatase [Chloroflexota bacterium]
MTRTEQAPYGVLLMTFGSPATLDDLPAYLSSVRGGRPVGEDVLAEFRRRYVIIGGSPLLRITQAQAAAVEGRLNEEACAGERYVVGVGMRHAPPLIADALAGLAAQGVKRVAALTMSPQYSPIIMGGYHRAVDAARDRVPGVEVSVAGAWHQHDGFLDALAERVREALGRLPEEVRDTAPVILTAHSLPKAVVDREPQYLEQLQETVRAIVERVGLADGRWQFAYQSAGHTPEEWLTPDFKDLLPGLAAQGHKHVLFVPTQFLADHLEILYDIDVAAREQAEAHGIAFHRIESLNVSPTFIDALADVARDELAREA